MMSFSIIAVLLLYEQIDSMLPCVCSVIYHRRCQNVFRTSSDTCLMVCVPLFCFHHMLTQIICDLLLNRHIANNETKTMLYTS